LLPKKEANVLNDYSAEIILACQSGIKELKAIIDYTEKLQSTINENMRLLYTDNRSDELPHIQNLVVALTAMLNGEEPTVAAQMDSETPEVDGDAADKSKTNAPEIEGAGSDAWKVN
jgi:hypothetical protein